MPRPLLPTVLLFAAVGLGCAHARNADSVEPVRIWPTPEMEREIRAWPIRTELERFTVDGDISVLAPPLQAKTDCWDRPRAMSHPYDRSCAWDGPYSARKLMVAVREKFSLPELATEPETLAFVHHELATPDGEFQRVHGLGGDYFQHLEHWEGMHVERRIFLCGGRAVVLYAAANEDDPFPEAEAFFRSLVVKSGCR